MYGVRKSKSWFRPCVSVFNLRMSLFFYQSVCADREISFQITRSRSQIEWYGLVKCLATGSPVVVSGAFCVIAQRC